MTNKMSSLKTRAVCAADLLFWGTAAFMLFWALGARGLWTAEGRWAEIAREMLLTRRFFHPTINGVPYFDKPLLTYWLIALTAPLTGMNEWALRIPSALCGLAALWATRWLGRKLWSPAVGRLAGWILLTSHGFLFWARTGQADMANLAFIILAVAWYWHRRDKPCFTTYLLFYVILFLGAQMKGLTALVIPVLVLVPDLLREKRWKQLFTIPHFAALAVGALTYIVPFLYSSITRCGDYQSSGLDLVFRENIQRFFDPFDHIEPWYAYFEHVPQLLLPWSPIFIIGLIAVLCTTNWRRYDWHSAWLGLAMLLIFLFFTASGSRRSYYILPILPFCALFSARLLLTSSRVLWRKVVISLQTFLLLFVTLAAWGAVATLFFFADKLPPALPLSLRWPLLGMALLSSLIWLSLKASKPLLEPLAGLPRRVAPIVLSTAVFLGGAFCLVMPVMEVNRTEKSFALAVARTGRTGTQVAFFDHYLENVIFYLDMCPPYHAIIPSSAAAYDFLAADEQNVILLRRRNLDQLLEGFPADRRGQAAVAEAILPWDKEKKTIKKMVAWSLKADGSPEEAVQ